MPSQQQLAREHHARQRKVAVAAVAAARVVAQQTRRAEDVAATVARYQAVAAATSAASIASGQGASSALTSAVAFAGETAAGFPLTDPLTALLDRYLSFARQGLASAPTATFPIDRFVHAEVIDAGREAAQVEMIAVNPKRTTGYVRVLRLPSCERCAVLAGAIYRWNEGFDRHPLCDCEHWPIESREQALADGLIADPLTAFEAGQIRGLSAADAQAVRDGADITQVINARRGMTKAVLFGKNVSITMEGVTKRGWYGGGYGGANPGGYVVERIGKYGYIRNQVKRTAKRARLRPQTIYQFAKDPEDAVRLLRLYGYITTPA